MIDGIEFFYRKTASLMAKDMLRFDTNLVLLYGEDNTYWLKRSGDQYDRDDSDPRSYRDQILFGADSHLILPRLAF